MNRKRAIFWLGLAFAGIGCGPRSDAVKPITTGKIAWSPMVTSTQAGSSPVPMPVNAENDQSQRVGK